MRALSTIGVVILCGTVAGCFGDSQGRGQDDVAGKGDGYGEPDGDGDGDGDADAAASVQCASAAIDAEEFEWVYEGHAFRFTAEDLGDGWLQLELVRGPMWPREWKQAAVASSAESAGAIERDLLWFSFEGGAAELAAAQPGLWTGTGRLDPDGEIAIACWSDEFAPEFVYHPATGRCIDTGGYVGLNPTTQPYVRETGDGECADLAGLQLNETDFGSPVLAWNLAGAVLTGAKLHFADLLDADLRGADLTDFEFGYATIDAEVDDFTTSIPCDPVGGRIECSN